MTESLAKRQIGIYNMWPRRYSEHKDGAFAGMLEDLDRMADLGYKAIYINPFFEIGHFPKQDNGWMGSLYATRDLSKTNPRLFAGRSEPFFDEKGQLTKSGQQVKDFCEAAKARGITPLFDLVQSHLSPDSPYIDEASKQGINIVARHKDTGKYDIHGLDKNYRQTNPHEVWDDVVNFDYKDPDALRYIPEKILTPYTRQMARLGFGGVRVDSPHNTPHTIHSQSVSAFKDELRQIAHEKKQAYLPPVILGETLGSDTMARELRGIATHVYGAGLFFPSDKERDYNRLFNNKDFLHVGRHWLKADMWDKQQNIEGGVVTPTSTHDTETMTTLLKERFANDLRNRSPEEQKNTLKKLARIRIAFSAFFSSGGHMMVAGDEYMNEQRACVFDGSLIKAGHKITLTDENLQELHEAAKTKGKGGRLFIGCVNTPPLQLRSGYEKPFWHYPDGGIPEKEGPVLVEIAPQMQMSEMQNLAKNNGHDLSDFVRRINKAMEKLKDIDKNLYADAYFDKSTDYLCIVRSAGAEGAPAYKHQIQDIVIVDVSGKKRHADITPAILAEFAEQTGISAQKLRDEAIIVGDFPERGKGAGMAQGR